MENTNFTRSQFTSFLTLPGEKLLAATRQHWFVILPSILLLVFFGTLISTLTTLIFFYIFHNVILVIINILCLFSLLINLLNKIIIDWYFHWYIITTKKILDVRYSPLFSHDINEVLLDQVRCTEVDVQANGITNEILHMGDVILTFDRPTHQEEFILNCVWHPKTLGLFLGDHLTASYPQQTTYTWFKGNNYPINANYPMQRDIFPTNILSLTGI